MSEICIVTSNQHKYIEITEIASEFGLKTTMCPGLKIELQYDSLEEIVFKSAMIAYLYLNKPLLVEDAGLFIESLNGFPGPYSSYVYRTIGITGVLRLLRDVDNRRACFKSAVALVNGSSILTATGEVCGRITTEPRGTRGFGFDPIFVPNGLDRTFAEMDIKEKNRYSHRAIAVRKAFQLLLSGRVT